MSSDCYVLITFRAHDKSGVIKAAQDILKICDDRDAQRILEHFAEGLGYGEGPKGDVCSFGFIGNYVQGDGLARHMEAFFKRMWPKTHRYAGNRINEFGLTTADSSLYPFSVPLLFLQPHYTNRVDIYQFEWPGEIKHYNHTGFWSLERN